MIAFLDLPSGLSGDMFLGCLVDVGWPMGELSNLLQRLGLPDGELSVSAQSVMRGPLRAMQVNVKTAETKHQRNLGDVSAIIRAADLSAVVKDRAVAVFTRLADAEATVHGTTPDKVHFHEVGALDAIADILGVCAGLAALGIDQLYCSALPVGGGWVNSAHGPLPLPAPATLQLLAAAGAPICPSPLQNLPPGGVGLSAEFKVHGQGSLEARPSPAALPETKGPKELVTPTAAALLAELAIFTQPQMQLQRIGVGAGNHQFSWPNVARLWLGQMQLGSSLVQIQTNIDDMNPQFFDSVCQKLLAAGALDVWLSPIQMKKNRPAVLLSLIAPSACEAVLADLLMRHTTTLGLRVQPISRREAQREFRPVQTAYGMVAVKIKRWNGEVVGMMPEYEDCRRLADAAGVAVGVVHQAALSGCR